MTILRIKAVCAKAGISRSRVYRLEAEKRFPSRIRLGPNSVGWLENEVAGWADVARLSGIRQPGEPLMRLYESSFTKVFGRAQAALGIRYRSTY